jgi:hypothetical protein
MLCNIAAFVVAFLVIGAIAVGCEGDVGEVVGALKAAGTAEAAGAAATSKTLTALSCT